MSTSFIRRAFVTLTIFIFFCIMLVTSILMFINSHNDVVALVHTLLGFSLLLMVFWHIKNNLNPLKHYFKLRTGARLNIALPIALATTSIWLGLLLLPLPAFRDFYQWGNILRAKQPAQQNIQLTYVRLDNTVADATGRKLTIDLRKGAYFHWPQYAIWLETIEGDFIQPLFITEKLAHNNFFNKATQLDKDQVFTTDLFGPEANASTPMFKFESSPETREERARPESLPVFLHQWKEKSAEFFSAQENRGSVDAYSGATILENFLLATHSAKPLPERYRVRLEINQSFDFNEFYSSNRFPDDPVYSGSGYSAQPSVIYEAVIDNLSKQSYYPMTIIGRGHHSGQDGKLHQDLENLTTALQIIDRIIVEIDN